MNLALLRKRANHQHEDTTCGACALRYAMLCYNEDHEEMRIARLAKVKWDGIGIDGLADAAEVFGFKVSEVVLRSWDEAFARLSEYLHRNVPVILEVDHRQHWITAVHATARHVTFCDSSYYRQQPTPVIQRMTWRRLVARMALPHGPEKTTFTLAPVEVA